MPQIQEVVFLSRLKSHEIDSVIELSFDYMAELSICPNVRRVQLRR